MIPLSGVLPLWLDEIIQLQLTRGTTTSEMIAALPTSAGSTPLGYLVQQETLKIAGYSVRWARFPSVILVSAAVFVVALLGMELGLERWWTGAAVFAVFPLTARYATEGRVYSQAIFFSVLATLLYLRLTKAPTWGRFVMYLLTLTAAIYIQPYAGFVGAAHILWSLALRDYKDAARGSAAMGLSALAFLPWYVWSKHMWVQGIASEGVHFAVSARTPLSILRELTGAGYWGAGLVLILWVVALAGHRFDGRVHRLLLLLITTPIACVLILDWKFNYFIAARQFLWVLPAIAVLAALAAERTGRAGLALLATLGVACILQDIKYFTGPREDWQLAAEALVKEVNGGTCLKVAPPDQVSYYTFFQPRLRDSACHGERVVLAATPYSTDMQRQVAEQGLAADGYRQTVEAVVGKTRITSFRRP